MRVMSLIGKIRLWFLTLGCLALALDAAVVAAPAATGAAAFEKSIKPLLNQYCYGCHGEKKKGDLDLRVYTNAASIAQDRKTWEKVMANVERHEMPPDTKPQPKQEDREKLVGWIRSELFKCDCDHPDPGRVTIRRLNRTEYNLTIRDLLGVKFKPAEDFPADDVGYGFDNIGDVLSMPPVLIEKYMKAADRILDEAIFATDPSLPKTNRFPANALDATGGGAPFEKGWFILRRDGDAYANFKFPWEGDYILRVRAYGHQAGPDKVKMAWKLDNQRLGQVEVPNRKDEPKVYEFRTRVTRGPHKVAVAFLNNFSDEKAAKPEDKDRDLLLEYLEVEGPFNPAPVVYPETHQRIFTRRPTPQTTNACVEEIVARFARRAYRRPVVPEEVSRLAGLARMVIRDGGTFEQGVRLTLQAILVSPHFLFRGELQPEPENPKAVHPVNEFALASRLSYFLWSTMPDEELLTLAEQGRLRKNLEPQVRRMLKDPKSTALVENFAGQWLFLRNLAQFTPDEEVFPEFDEPLRAAMQKETETFFGHIARQDRSVLELIDADYTFVNQRLARHYGLKDIAGDEFQKVSLKGTPRGGLLTQASILAITSNPTRTSPVKRGKWVLENLLGAPPPPPPPDVPELKEGPELKGTLRQRMEQHRDNALCASCHARLDPIGFGLENFDAIGVYRQTDGVEAIDPAGKLTTGESFKGAGDLRAIIAKKKRTEFVRCLSEKMLTYALGRGLEWYDKCSLDQVTTSVTRRGHRFSALIMGVVQSPAFQMRRGEDPAVVATQ